MEWAIRPLRSWPKGWVERIWVSFDYIIARQRTLNHSGRAMGPSVRFNSVAQSCSTLCGPMDCSTPGLPVHHQLLEFTQI